MIIPLFLNAANPYSKPTSGEHTFPKRPGINNSYFYSLRTLGREELPATPTENLPRTRGDADGESPKDSTNPKGPKGAGGLSDHWASSWWGCGAQRWWRCCPPPRGYPKGCAWSPCSSPGHPRQSPSAGSARRSPAGSRWCKARKTEGKERHKKIFHVRIWNSDGWLKNKTEFSCVEKFCVELERFSFQISIPPAPLEKCRWDWIEFFAASAGIKAEPC